MRKFIVMLSLVLLLASCNETAELSIVESKSVYIDKTSLVLTEVYLVSSDTRIIEFEDVQEAEIKDLTLVFFEHAEENKANYYGPIFPNKLLALLTFSNKDFTEIYVFITESNDEDSSIMIGLEISEAVDFKEIHYVLDISEELYDMILDFYE